MSALLVLSLLLLCGCGAQGADSPGTEHSQPLRPVGEGSVPAGEEAIQLPVLMYHHLTQENSDGGSGVPVSTFRDQMRALYEAGYHPVSFDQVLAWVEQGGELPEKPIVITFDDGYRSNYELAYPILREYDFKATIFVIGVSVGKTTYKDTDLPMTPHFSMEQAAEMENSGLISIQSHGFNIHEQRNYDPEPVRDGILQRQGESEEDYIAFLHEDCAKMKELLGKTPTVLAYPHGVFDDLSDAILREEGIRVTLTTRRGINTLVRGDADCMWRMDRIGCTDSMTGETLLEMLMPEA